MHAHHTQHIQQKQHTQAQLILRLVPIAICAIGVAVACVSRDAADPLLRERVLSVDAGALERLLDRSAELQGTPLGREAERLQKRLEACSEVWGHFKVSDEPAGSDLADYADAIRCASKASASAELKNETARLRGGHAGLLLWPIGEDGRIEVRFDVDAQGGLQVDGLAIPPTQQDAWRLLIPSDEAPAPALLAADQALVYARARPAGGLALSQLIPTGGQADRLFALKGRLLEGALLDGTWEFAFMPPAAGTELPLATLALHHRLAGPVREALSEALDQLERTWPITRTARNFATADGTQHEGGCYLELPLLPGLAPCWVVTGEALFVGYRDVALESALAGGASDDSAFGGLDVQLSRFHMSGAADGDTSVDAGSYISGSSRSSGTGGTGGAENAPRLGDLYSLLHIDLAPAAQGRVALTGTLRSIQ